MTSPKTLDFPLPPRRGSSEIRSPPLGPFPTTVQPQQQQLARILELTNRYRTQTVTLLARHEALQTEQKNVFDLERQLWNTEREIWEEERRLLTAGIGLPGPSGVYVSSEKNSSSNETPAPIHSPTGQLNHTTRFLSVSSMAESTKGEREHGQGQGQQQAPPEPQVNTASSKKRDSYVGGVRLGWYLKQGMPSGTDASAAANESVSPKAATGRVKGMDSPRYGSTSEVGPTIDEEAVDSADFDITPSLIAEATKLVYGDRAGKRSSFSSSSTATKRGVGIPTLLKSLADAPDASGVKGVRRVSSLVYPGTRAGRYLNRFSDDDGSDDDRGAYERGQGNQQAANMDRKSRKRSVSHPEKNNEEPPVPLRLRPSSNFGAAFASVREQQMLAPPQPSRQGSMSSSTFYHPETPVDSLGSQRSFREASWSARRMPNLADNSLGGDSMHSNPTIKSPTQATNVKSAPWGVTSINVTSPTFGAGELPHGLKPSPSNLTSSLSISSSQNSPIRPEVASTSSRYSTDEVSLGSGHLNRNYSSNNTGATSASGEHHHYHHQQKGKTSPPTYTWTPPPPMPTSPAQSAASSRKSGLYGTTILLSPSTVAPSTKANLRLSAVGGIMPRSPPIGRMGTSSMLLSVSSKSENGDDDDEELEDHSMELEEHELNKRLNGPNGMLEVSGTNNGKPAQTRLADGYSDAPVEIVRDARWGNMLPGGMI
ncbi:hypothetical protein DRE_00367 [Drechslerella stenobrocha 248]|uniref:Uncharacterized protein n=1 Tax=Drechslerella stenobrocha 248 TaxID=1043628 RepID=W7HV52_9PEZI|nr:hypothetical protein DRE_00367 [Drechslerella stenobrocha 248]